jgi:hypothetical protein
MNEQSPRYAEYYNKIRTHRSLTKMQPPIAPFSGSETLRHMLSSAACITIMYGFGFSVHTASK